MVAIRALAGVSRHNPTQNADELRDYLKMWKELALLTHGALKTDPAFLKVHKLLQTTEQHLRALDSYSLRRR